MKKIWDKGNQNEGDFQKIRGNPTFQVEFRDRKGQKGDFWGQISINFFKTFPVVENYFFRHILCMPFLNASKEFLQSYL